MNGSALSQWSSRVPSVKRRMRSDCGDVARVAWAEEPPASFTGHRPLFVTNGGGAADPGGVCSPSSILARFAPPDLAGSIGVLSRSPRLSPGNPRVDAPAPLLPIARLTEGHELDALQPLGTFVAVHTWHHEAQRVAVPFLERLLPHPVGHEHIRQHRLIECQAIL